MDLQTIRDGLHLKKYQNREEFLSDVNQIVENSTLYNGKKIEKLIFIFSMFYLIYTIEIMFRC